MQKQTRPLKMCQGKSAVHDECVTPFPEPVCRCGAYDLCWVLKP